MITIKDIALDYKTMLGDIAVPSIELSRTRTTKDYRR
jgi:hypothetical protein